MKEIKRMILTKITAETSNGYMAVFMNPSVKKSFSASGNIPYLPSGISMDIDLVGKFIVDYSVHMTKRNKKLLEKAGIDPEGFLYKVKLHKQYGVLWREINEDLNNPYAVIKDFVKADVVFCQSGRRANERDRIRAIGAEIIAYFRERRVWEYTVFDYLEAFHSIEGTGAFDERLNTADIMNALEKDNRLCLENAMLKDDEVLKARNFVIQDIKRRKNACFHMPKTEIEKYLMECDVMLSEEQKQAVRELSTDGPVMVTGGAGTGKTTTIKSIIECCEKICSRNYTLKDHILLLAPTGRAARRITESVHGKYTARTIHHALRKSLTDSYVYYGYERKLPYRLIIVDESSMIDMLLMRDLLLAVDDDAKIFFIGDCNQLYPVGCGEPFLEFLEMNLCRVVRLQVNFRQGGDFLHSTILINAGNILEDKPMVAGKDFIIKYIHKRDILKYADSQIQNITPYNDMNDLINCHIHETGMPQECRNGREITPQYYPGEKVISGINTEHYCNGDIGIIKSVNESGVEISFDDLGDGKRNMVFVPWRHMKDLRLANAITVHKMQGTECDYLRIFLPQNPTPFISKRMVYTAVTRAKKYVELYLYDNET